MPMSNDTKRRKTRYRGISYRERKDGTRTYSIYWRGNYTAVEGGENEALAKQAELRGKAARGEQVVVPTKLTFAVAAPPLKITFRRCVFGAGWGVCASGSRFACGAGRGRASHCVMFERGRSGPCS